MAAGKLQAYMVCLSWQGTQLRSLCCWQACISPSVPAPEEVSVDINYLQQYDVKLISAASGMQALVQARALL